MGRKATAWTGALLRALGQRRVAGQVRNRTFHGIVYGIDTQGTWTSRATVPTWKENPGPTDLCWGPDTPVDESTDTRRGRFRRGSPGWTGPPGPQGQDEKSINERPRVFCPASWLLCPRVPGPGEDGRGRRLGKRLGTCCLGDGRDQPPHLDHRGGAGISSHRRKRSGRPLPWHPTTAGCSGFNAPGPDCLSFVFCLLSSPLTYPTASNRV